MGGIIDASTLPPPQATGSQPCSQHFAPGDALAPRPLPSPQPSGTRNNFRNHSRLVLPSPSTTNRHRSTRTDILSPLSAVGKVPGAVRVPLVHWKARSGKRCAGSGPGLQPLHFAGSCRRRGRPLRSPGPGEDMSRGGLAGARLCSSVIVMRLPARSCKRVRVTQWGSVWCLAFFTFTFLLVDRVSRSAAGSCAPGGRTRSYPIHLSILVSSPLLLSNSL